MGGYGPAPALAQLDQDAIVSGKMITMRFLSEAEWPAISGQFKDLTFEQSLTYSKGAATRIGGQARYVVLERAQQPVAAACVRSKNVPGLKRGIAWIASGPMMKRSDHPEQDNETFRDILVALRQQFVEQEGHILRLRLPGIALHDCDVVQKIANNAGFVPTTRAPGYRSSAIDLSQGEDVLMKRLNGKWRTDLRYALKSGLTLERGKGTEFENRFLTMFIEVQEAKGFRSDVTPEFHFALNGPDLSHDILIATKDELDVAGIVIGTTGRTALYLFGATTDAGRPVRAGYFLTWAGIMLSLKRRMDWYDLGGVDFDANPAVTRFKERMNGQLIKASGPFEACPSGLGAELILALEGLRKRLKPRG